MPGLKMNTESQLLEVTVHGNTAWSRVALRVAVTKPDGNTVRREGHAMSLYLKQADGRWLMARDANMLGPPK